MFCVAQDYSDHKLNTQQYKQKTSLIRYKREIKILAYPRLA